MGYAYTVAGENIAIMRRLKSAGRADFLARPPAQYFKHGYTKVGIGVALDQNGYVYLTQIFCR